MFLKLFQDILDLNIKITGKLGLKTKYQTTKIAQLVVETFKEKESSYGNNEVVTDLKSPEEEKTENITPKMISIEESDDMTVLLEKPKIDDLNSENLKKVLSSLP